ncbi:DUF1365 domain-containing protein [Rhodobacterales bacterium]|nr:DUF1365 domain-containing protein [Rhodobacterales bacterium]
MIARPTNRLSDNGSPPDAPVSLYLGTVMHQRMKPAEHRFAYEVFSVLLDLDRLSEASRTSRLFSVNRFNLVSFHEKDHGPRDGTSLRSHIDRLLDGAGLQPPARVKLLAYPRVLGYAFNPLSVYYCYGADERVTALVYEVRNTFGGIHTYVAPVAAGELSDSGIRQHARKEFYVSPFVDMEQHYHFRMMPPGRTVRVRILEKDESGPLLSATFSGSGAAMTNRSILRACARVPLLGLKVIGAIHWQAFKIWRKRVPFHARPGKASSDGAQGQFMRRVQTTSR